VILTALAGTSKASILAIFNPLISTGAILILFSNKTVSISAGFSALVPENEIMEYVNDLKSITQGAGYFNRKFYSYEEAPFDVQEKLKKAYANK